MTRLLFTLLFLVIYCDQTLEAEPKRVPIQFILDENQSNADLKYYSLHVAGFSPRTSVKLTAARLDNLYKAMVINTSPDGTLVDSRGDKAYVAVGHLGYGEPLIICVQPCSGTGRVGKFRKIEAYGLLVPNPLETKDAKGHSAQMIAPDDTGLIFTLKLEGYKPFEKVRSQSRSCDEYLDLCAEAEANGTVLISYAPGVIGQVEGPFSLTIQGEDSTLFLQHYWGKIAFTPPDEYLALKNKFPTFFQGR